MKFEIVNHYDHSADDVIEATLDLELQERLFEALSYEQWEETEFVEQDDETARRVLAITPPVNLPGFIRSALGNSSSYVETQIWSEDRYAYEWSVAFELSRLIHLNGTCEFRDDDGKCVRTVLADLTVDIPLIGGRIAAYIRDQTIDTQNQFADELNRRLSAGT
jgi:hypothetical protein